jgi:hypothetical protein
MWTDDRGFRNAGLPGGFQRGYECYFSIDDCLTGAVGPFRIKKWYS